MTKILTIPSWLTLTIIVNHTTDVKLGHYLFAQYKRFPNDSPRFDLNKDKFKKGYDALEDFFNYNVTLTLNNVNPEIISYELTLNNYSNTSEFKGNTLNRNEPIHLLKTKTELTTDIIETHLGGGDFNMEDKDSGHTYWKLDKSGVVVHGCTMYSYEQCDATELSGLDGALEIVTEEDLNYYNTRTLKEICIELQKVLAIENDYKFPIENYVELTSEEKAKLFPLKSEIYLDYRYTAEDITNIVISFTTNNELEFFKLISEEVLDADIHKGVTKSSIVMLDCVTNRTWDILYERGTSSFDISILNVTEYFEIPELMSNNTLLEDNIVLFLYSKGFNYNAKENLFKKTIIRQVFFNIDINPTSITLSVGSEDNVSNNCYSNLDYFEWKLSDIQFKQAWKELCSKINKTT
jgi:hypothetical protein